MPDASHSTDQTEESLDPAEAFSLLGEDRRLEIIVTLDEATTDRVPFSELQDRVDIEDSGQFNYHLSQLVGHFVSKTDEGYALTAAGERFARAVAAGLYTDSPVLAPFGVGGTCNSCGEAALDASYAEEQFTIACSDCGEPSTGTSTCLGIGSDTAAGYKKRAPTGTLGSCGRHRGLAADPDPTRLSVDPDSTALCGRRRAPAHSPWRVRQTGSPTSSTGSELSGE